MWWVVVVAGLTFHLADHVVNQMSYRYFSSRAEYLFCLQGTVKRNYITIDDYETVDVVWSSYNGAATTGLPCTDIPGVVAVLHPHLPVWQSHIWPREGEVGQTGGAMSACGMSVRDATTWKLSSFPFSVVQCDVYTWAIFLRSQLDTWDGQSLSPWHIMHLRQDATPEWQ